VKTIGLIGGMSWESTRIYYELINRDVQQQLGGIHSAKMLIASLDMQHIAELQQQAKWDEAEVLLASTALNLQSAGAEVIALATNTMHKCASQIVTAIKVPFLHVADAVIAQLQRDRRSRSLLLATRFTMEQTFYRDKFSEGGVETIIPSQEERSALHDIIYAELCKGIVLDASRQVVLDMIVAAKHAGADSVILGCTEICMLVDDMNSALPVYDTTKLHAKALVDFALR